MSEATRQRWLYVRNRLEELAAKFDQGPTDETESASADLDPSWGPVGSLLGTIDPRLLALHRDMLALERSRTAAGKDGPPMSRSPDPAPSPPVSPTPGPQAAEAPPLWTRDAA